MSHAFRATVMIAAAASALSGMAGERLYAQGADPNAAPNPYKMQENWAQLPEGRKFGAAIKVQVDHSDGKSIWVFDRCGASECTNSTLAPMEKFDSSGKFQKAIGADRLLAARAQQRTMPVIGFLSANRTDAFPNYIAAFHEGLAEGGFVEGKNVAIEFRFAEQRLERVPALAMDLVRRKVAVILTTGGDVPAMVAKGVTSTIPIVFLTGFDPVKSGLVASLNRPGGNLTGATVIAGQLVAKRLELLRELVPAARIVGVLANPNNPNADGDTAEAQTAGRALGQEIHVLLAEREQEVDAAFTTLAFLKADALVLDADPLFANLRGKIIALVERRALPTVYYSREYADAGGLISYGASFTGLYRQGGIYVGRILKGAKPAELPVVQPTKFDLIINRKTAKALGLEVPAMLLARADEVIE
jgi:putative ABC transport system substrate-binding protein